MGTFDSRTIWIAAIVIAWVAGTYWFFYLKNKAIVLMPGTGALRSDDDVIVSPHRVVVNVVFANSTSVDQDLLADMTVNVKDLLSGAYKPTDRAVTNKTVTAPGPTEEGEKDEEEEVDLSGEPELNTDLKEEDIPEPDNKYSTNVSEPADLKEFNL